MFLIFYFLFQPVVAATRGGPGRLIGRNTEDPATAHWKGYKGGCAGEVWIDASGDGAFKRLDIRVQPSSGGGGGGGNKNKGGGTPVGNIGGGRCCTPNVLTRLSHGCERRPVSTRFEKVLNCKNPLVARIAAPLKNGSVGRSVGLNVWSVGRSQRVVGRYASGP